MSKWGPPVGHFVVSFVANFVEFDSTNLLILRRHIH